MKSEAAALKKFRAQFPALDKKTGGKRLIYLDSACTALKSRAVAEAVSRFYTESGVCGGKRSTHLMAQGVEEMISRARSAAARFINAASANEIVFTSGTTEAFNLLARSFAFEGQRKEVVITDLEHNAVFLPFHELECAGKIRLRICPTENGALDLNRLQSLVTDKTALVAMTQASNVYGGVLPVAQAARIAHAKGALIAVDAAQHAATHAQDVQASNIDFMAFSAHKLGGPFGLGIFYGKEHLLNGLGRFKTGGGTLKTIARSGNGWDIRYLDAPMKFEAGVGNYAAFAGLIPAFNTLNSLGFEALREHISGLVASFMEGLSRISGIRVLGEYKNLIEGAIVSFTFLDPKISAVDFNLYLNHQLPGRLIAVRTGEHCAHLLHASHGMKETVRASFFGYNTQEEAAAFLEALRIFLKKCRPAAIKKSSLVPAS